MESKGAVTDTRYGLVAIEIFTKIAEVVPISDRPPEAMIDGLDNMFTSVGKPRQLYSDEESSMRPANMKRFLRDNEIKSVQTTTHAHTVERVIITFKNSLYMRLDSLNEETTEWITHKDNIRTKKEHNSIEHSITQIKLNGAGKNHLWVNWHFQNAAKNNRQQPELTDGDMFRFKLKPSIGLKVMNRNGVRLGMQMLVIHLIINIPFQV